MAEDIAALRRGKTAALDGRLSAAASFVREGGILADVGTDHAYLPIYLVSSGKIASAVASDVSEGPLSRAREHIASCGLNDRISAVLCDGLSGLEHFHPTDIAICGMGGELIASILDAAPWVKDPALRLILQPMTMQPHLRRCLYAGGFAIEEETLAAANGKIYPIFRAAYTGKTAVLSAPDAYFGGYLLSHRASVPLFPEYLSEQCSRLRAVRAGKQKAGLPTDTEDALLEAVSPME